MRRMTILASALTIAVAAGAWVASANTPADVIKSRIDYMKDIGANFKAIGDAAKAGNVDKADATARATKINELAQKVGAWFPPGTGPDSGVKTRALPEIWTKPAEFTAAVDKFKAETAKLVAAAQTGNAQAIAAQHAETGKSCGGCHNPFRAKQ